MLNLLLTVVGLLTALYWYLTKNHDYWRSRGVITLKGVLPGVGNMWDVFMLKKSAGWFECEMYSSRQAKDQPAVGFYDFRRPALLLRDPDLIKTALISEFSSFHDNTVTVDATIDPYVSKNPFVLRGQKWKTTRQKLAPALSNTRTKLMFPLLYNICQEFNTYLEKRQHEDIDVNYVTGLFVSEVLAKCAFGVDGNALKDSKSEFYQQGRHMWDASIYDPLNILLNTYFPLYNKMMRKSFYPKPVMNFFASLVKQAADYRESNPGKVPDNDYLQFLLNLHSKDETFSFDDVIAQSLTLYTDGFETSAVTSSFAIYELTMNPEIQEALRQEVRSMEAFSYENIMALPLLDRVLQEILRMYCGFSMSRECSKDFVLRSGGRSFPVSKGHEVVVPVYAIHHDPEIYPNPSKFDPDRFLPENVKIRHPSTFLGFGAGPRICIGIRFAVCQVKVLLANLLANFRLVKCSKTVTKITLDPTQIMPVSKEGIWVGFQKL